MKQDIIEGENPVFEPELCTYEEKNFEKRVKKYLKLLTGKGKKPVDSLCHLRFLRGVLLGIEMGPQHVRSTEKMLRLVLAFGQV